MNRILIIEDDPDIAQSLRYALEREGAYRVDTAADGESGLTRAAEASPDLVLLDLNLPGIGGLDVCRALRARPGTAAVPILMLTARVEEADKVAGLELGADDYVTKPFSVKEVVARIRALLRRARSDLGDADATLQSGPLRLDPTARRTYVGDAEVSLTRKEFDLLLALMRKPGRVLSRDRLLDSVWGYDHPGATRTVDVHVRQLRRKLGAEVAAYIQTVVGIGYRFRETT